MLKHAGRPYSMKTRQKAPDPLQHLTVVELRLAPAQYTIVRLSPATTVLTRQLPTGVTIAARDTASFFAWGLTETMAITLRQDSTTKVVRTTASGQVTCD